MSEQQATDGGPNPHYQERELTYGEKLVRVDFNPTGNQLVNNFKQFTADLIDMCHENKNMDPRLMALAITSYECAAMWAVKAATSLPTTEAT